MFKSQRLILSYWLNLITIKLLLIPVQKTRWDLMHLGNKSAAWTVPASLISSKSICYCAGVGEDISFEKALSKYKRPFIFLFDPTPRAIQFIKNQKLPPKFTFSPWGLWPTNSKQKFYAPSKSEYVSHSIVNLHRTTDYFMAECKSLDWTMNNFGHTYLDLLKIDIEGAEYMVLEQLLKTKVRPKVLAVEFDQPTPVTKTFTMIKKLISNNYTLVDQTGWNFIFVYDQKKL